MKAKKIYYLFIKIFVKGKIWGKFGENYVNHLSSTQKKNFKKKIRFFKKKKNKIWQKNFKKKKKKRQMEN